MTITFRPLFVSLTTSAALLTMSACGGGDSEAGPPPVAEAPQGIHLGFYAEDPINNPEDPTTGAFVLNLPKGNGEFAGNMFFTYVGCQSINVGKVSGTKTADSLTGAWSGTLDGVAHAGKFNGTLAANLGGYAGSYTNDGGKQYRDLRPCIEYHTAALGTWELHPEGVSTSTDFALGVSGRTITWTGEASATSALLYVLDTTLANGAQNPVIAQSFVSPRGGSLSLPNSLTLTSGRDYIVAVGLIKNSNERVAFGSTRFKAP